MTIWSMRCSGNGRISLVPGTVEPVSALVLYGTSACHLCEIAEEMLESYRKNTPNIRYSSCDISESDELFSRYGLKIPVLQNASGEELCWPFSVGDLQQFLA